MLKMFVLFNQIHLIVRRVHSFIQRTTRCKFGGKFSFWNIEENTAVEKKMTLDLIRGNSMIGNIKRFLALLPRCDNFFCHRFCSRNNYSNHHEINLTSIFRYDKKL